MAEYKEIFTPYVARRLLKMFDSIVELTEQSETLFEVKLISSDISNVCVGKYSNHKGYIFSHEKLIG